MNHLLDRLFSPVWAGPWVVTRWLFVFSQLLAHGMRFFRLGDAYGIDDMLFTAGAWRLTNYVHWSYTMACTWWGVGVVGLAATAWGGKLAKPGVFIYILGAWALLAEEALNVKAHDRLALWVAIGLLLGPSGEKHPIDAWRSPAARWLLLIVFSAIYGSTGTLKVRYEPGWFDGTALASHLLLSNFSGRPFAVWMSTQTWFTFIGGWWTVLFECAFPVLVWFRRTNPWVLALGCVFHLAVLALMDVGAFSWVSLAAYPVLLHPEVARGLYLRWRPNAAPPLPQEQDT